MVMVEASSALFLIGQAVVDLCLLGIAVYWFFFRVPRREKHLEERFQEIRRLLAESDAAVRRFEHLFQEDQERFKQRMEQQEQQERKMRSLVRETESLLERLERERLLLVRSARSRGSGSYERILELASSGMSPADISKETGVPENEVQLLLDVRK